MTKQGPPARLDAIVAALTPPGRREEVLGDLYERFQNPAQYAKDAARTLPLVVASQIRRTTTLEGLLLEAFALSCSFFIGALRIGGTSFLSGQSRAVPILVPVAAGMLALRFVNAYTSGPKQTVLRSALGAAIAVLAAFWAESILFLVGPGQALWGWPLIRGGIFALVLLSKVRMSFPELAMSPRVPGPEGKQAPSPGAIRRENADFRETIRQRNLREYIAAGFVIAFFGANLVRTHLIGARIGSALIVAGMLCIVYRLYRSGSARTAPPDANFTECVDFYRRELERQRDLLRHIWSWYLGPTIPGLLVLLGGAEIAHPQQPWVLVLAFVTSALFIVIARLNRKGAQKLQLKIDELNRIRSQNS